MSRRIISIVAIMLAPLLPGLASAADPGCLDYEPALVTLTGTITRHMEYGAPGFGEDPVHDEKEVYWYLDLDTPICVNGGSDDSFDEEESGIQRLQIVYGRYPRGRGWIGHRVSIAGTLFHAENGHHHTKVLIQATKTEKLSAR